MALTGGFDLGTAYAKILIDEQGVDSGISSIKDKFQNLGGSLTSIGAGMTAIGAPFLAVAGLAVKAASDYQDQVAQLDAVLKSTTSHNGEFSTSTAMSADDLQKLSDKLSTATNKLSDMQTVYDSNTKHSVAQTLALKNQKDEVASLTTQLTLGSEATTQMTNVTHLSRQAFLDLAYGYSQVTKFSKDTVLSAEDMLLTFTNIGKDVFPDATKAVLNMSQALGQDTKSSAIQLGKALQDPIKGVTALRRVGVALTDSQKAMIEQMVAAGDTMGAQRLILKELETEFGGSAEAAGKTFSGQLAILQHNFQDLLEMIGEKIMPILEQFIGWIKSAIFWFENLDPSIQNIIIGIGLFMASLAIIGPVIATIGLGLSALGTIIGGIGTVIGIIMGPIGLLIAAIVGLYLAFQSNFLGIRDFLQPIFDSISKFFEHFSDNVKLYGSLILLYAQYYFQGVVTEIQKIIKGIQDFIAANPAFSGAMILIGGAVVILVGIMAALPVIIGVITGAVGLLTGALGILLSPAVLLIAAIAGIVYAADKLYPGGLVKLFNDASTAAKELAFLGMYVLATAANWVEQKLNELLNTLKTVLDKIKEFLGIQTQIGGTASSQMTNYANSLGGGGSQPGFGAPNTNGVQPIPPVGGGSAAPLSQQQNHGLSIDTVHVYANDAAGGAKAADAFAKTLEDRYRGRGNG